MDQKTGIRLGFRGQTTAILIASGPAGTTRAPRGRPESPADSGNFRAAGPGNVRFRGCTRSSFGPFIAARQFRESALTGRRQE